MKRKFISTVLLVLIFVCIENCETRRADDVVRIAIKQAGGYKDLKAKVSVHNIFSFEPTILAETQLNDSVLVFHLQKSTFATIELGTLAIPVYIMPGSNLEISVDFVSNRIAFSGIDADVNNYLVGLSKVQSRLELVSGKRMLELSMPRILQSLDSAKSVVQAYHQHFTDSITFSPAVSKMLEERGKLVVVGLKQNYGWAFASKQQTFSMPKELSIKDDIPFDTVLLNRSLLDYGLILQGYIQSEFFIPYMADREPQSIDVKIMNSKIHKTNFPELFREFFIAKNIEYWMATFGLNHVVDSLYKNYTKYHSKSVAAPSLNAQHEKWAMISPGRLAPKFSGLTPEGKKMSSTDLKGKVVYVDVWASWCGPCRKEFVFSKRLQQKFRNNNNIAFVFVSVDRDKDTWLNLVRDDYDVPNGIHIITQDSLGESIEENYIIGSVPRYILIDQESRIISPIAPRPSSKEIFSEISALLKRD